MRTIDATEFTSSTKLDCEIVVVGSGAGGAPLAWSLAKAGWDVILIEEGSHFRTNDFSRRVWESTRTMYRDAGGTVSLGVPAIPIPLGRTWGGTTTINSGTCLRVPEFMFDKWNRDTSFQLGLQDLLPYYQMAEEIQNVEPVSDTLMGEGNRLFRAGAEKLGLRGKPLDRNTRDCKGSGLCAFGCPTGAKQAMGQTFLPQALEAGLRGYTGLRAVDVQVRGGRATGLVAHPLRQAGDLRINRSIKVKIQAKKVVLAMGSIYTPWFLLRNQLANASGEVGRNLSIHPAAKLLGVFNHDLFGWQGVPQAYLVDEFHEEGIVFEGAFIPPAALAFALPALGQELKSMMQDYNKIAGFGVMVSDSTRGKISAGFGGRPMITYNLNKEDTLRFRKGVAIGAQVYLEAGAREVISPIFGRERIRSTDEAKDILSMKLRPADLELIAFHPVGTCRMGSDRYRDVVRPDGRTWDIPGLYISDGSLLPGSPSVNPQLTIMALALRIADGLNAKRN